MNTRIKVAFWRDGYAPCMIQTRPVSARHTDAIVKTVARNGGPVDAEKTALLSYDDIGDFGWLSRADMNAIGNGETVVKIVNAWDYAHCYGYDAHTLFE